jgi:hypothetical protein
MSHCGIDVSHGLASRGSAGSISSFHFALKEGNSPQGKAEWAGFAGVHSFPPMPRCDCGMDGAPVGVCNRTVPGYPTLGSSLGLDWEMQVLRLRLPTDDGSSVGRQTRSAQDDKSN